MLVTAFKLMVAVMVFPVPDVVPVKTAVYLPLRVSETIEPNVPLEVPLPSAKATVTAVVRWFPFASLAIRVTSVVSPEGIEDRPTDTVDWLGEELPGVTVTVGEVLVTDPELMVAVIVVAVPELVPVNTAVYLPLRVSETIEPNVPLEVPLPNPNATVTAVPRRLPLASRAINVTNVVSPELIELLPTETVDCVSEYAPEVTVMEGSVLVTDCPPMVAVTVRAEPEVVPVKMVVYLPLRVSETIGPNVPLEVPLPSPKTTVTADARWFPFASFAFRVTSVVSPEEINDRPTDIVD